VPRTVVAAKHDRSDTAGVRDAFSIGELSSASDVSPADWVVAGVRNFEYDVGSLVPTGFAAYARVFHPTYLTVMTPNEAGEGAQQVGLGADARWLREVSWAEVAAANGRIAHPAMEWIAITGSWRFLDADTQPGVWDYPPCQSSLPPRQQSRIATVAAPHTTASEVCWFAVWEGYSGLKVPQSGLPTVAMPQRPMLLFSGPLSGATTSFVQAPFHQSASLWWPDDRAWCVATDVDLMTTYIGGSEPLIDSLVNAEDLEVMRVGVDQRVTWDTDKLNPAPSDPES
jgi:hypothetical protein